MSSTLSIRRDGRAGRITLCRPSALNALNHEMVGQIAHALEEWRGDDAVDLVLLDAEGERAFCAGGDIQALFHAGKAGDTAAAQRFWRDEYRLVSQISSYPKPVVAFLHGFVFGGGVGIGCHASHRIVCETTRISLPECAIGLVPDVGSTLLLGAAPGHLGEFLGLTGTRMEAGLAIRAGFADGFVPELHWRKLKQALCRNGDSRDIDLAFASPPACSFSPCDFETIYHCFSADSMRDIALTAEGNDLLSKSMEAASPLSLAVALQLIRQARRLDTIQAALEAEFRFTARSLAQSDFLEGVRAAVIDKDKSPLWQHGSVSQVTDEDVAKFLGPLPAKMRVFSNQKVET